MPGSLNGIGLLRFIKKRFSKPPVILASGHLDPSIALAEGAKHLLTKPYQISTVLNLVASQLEDDAE
jgi:FixJ family two-component response regulator